MILEYSEIKPGMIIKTSSGELYITFNTVEWGIIGINNGGWITLKNASSSFTPVEAYLPTSFMPIKEMFNNGVNSIDSEDLPNNLFKKVLPEKKFLTKVELEKLIGFEFEIIEDN